MKKHILYLFLIFQFAQICIAQTWKPLPNAPRAIWRHDDIFFINQDTGWVVNVDGNIYKTTNGGNYWDTIVENSNTSYRCVGFANSNLGWVGNLGPDNWAPTTDTVPLYQTNDGGITWNPISNISGTPPTGICGINVVNDSVVYAVGRVDSPPFVLKTTNGGASWESIDLSSIMRSIIDCYFFNADTGIIIGSTVASDFINARALILYTVDGGQNWETKYTSPLTSTLAWKINFSDENTAYVSTESMNNDSVYVIKTTDRGITWEEKLVVNQAKWFQGIGFIDNNKGWVGAQETYTTNDGGNTWDTTTFVLNFNRFRKINDTLAYAVGKEIWKYSNEEILSIPKEEKKYGSLLDQNFPNPFVQKTTIPYYVPERMHVAINIYDFAGRHIKTLVDEVKNKGKYQVDFEIDAAKSAVFFYSINTGSVVQTKSMFSLKSEVNK